MSRDDWNPDEAWEVDDDWLDDGPSSDEDDADTIPCPHCRREVYEDAQECPYCHQYLLATTRHPRWIVWVAVVLLVVFAWASIGWWLG